MSWLDSLVNEIGNQLLPITGNENIGIIADRLFSADGNIIYHHNGAEIKPQNLQKLTGFHLVNEIRRNESGSNRIIKGQYLTGFLSVLLIGDESLDREHVLKLASSIGRCSPTCKGAGATKVKVLSIQFDMPKLINAYFPGYKDILIQKQTGLRIYKIDYSVDAAVR